MKRFIVIVLDGFGIGAMTDTSDDKNANTLGSILKEYPLMKLESLETLGIMNAYGFESENMKFSKAATFGKSKLMHIGADTFMGHQEIMGTMPKKQLIEPFSKRCTEISESLMSQGHKVTTITKEGVSFLLVDDCVTVGDNLEAELGMVYNVTAPLNEISFENELSIAKKVREIAKVNRVIAFGGTASTAEDLLNAAEVKDGKYIGINATKSKSYISGYQCVHLGYGVNDLVQVPALLAKKKIDVSLFGKVADIVENSAGKRVSEVDTKTVLEKTIDEMNLMSNGFICINVQETDLAGHSQNTKWYKEVLEIADEKIGEIMSNMNSEDVLIIMADHGNDPTIGHNKHTRENVPILVYKKDMIATNLGERNTLSDVGSTVCEFFGSEKPQNGTSFLGLINSK